MYLSTKDVVCIQVKGGFMYFVTKCKGCTVSLQDVHKEGFVYCIHEEYCNKEEICNLFPWILERGNKDYYVRLVSFEVRYPSSVICQTLSPSLSSIHFSQVPPQGLGRDAEMQTSRR